MSWKVQVRLYGTTWHDVRPTGSDVPYTFSNHEEAMRMMQMCYPDQVRQQRMGGETVVRVVPAEVR